MRFPARSLLGLSCLLVALCGQSPSTSGVEPMSKQKPRQDAKPKPERKPGAGTDEQVAALQRLGAWLTRDEQLPDKPIVGVDLSYTEIPDADLKVLLPLQQLQKLNLHYAPITDAGL